MKSLYLNNYKGFKETFIPIVDINFFVGENSTGKTAILNLLNIISKPQFWFNLDFNDNNIELGYFEEIANKSQSQKNKYFEIGVEMPDSKNNNHNFILLHFISKGGIPHLDSFRINIKNQTIFIKIKNRSIS